MDPDANLAEQRLLAKEILECACPGGACNECTFNGNRLAELVDALDGWIKSGGFLPADWRARNA